jgi:DNA repair photolyase
MSREWEPNAALPSDRIYALHAFHERGIQTWVSIEPVLDPAIALEIIRLSAPFVDKFKVGVLNYHPRAKEIDWRKFAQDAKALLESLGKHYLLKQDLARYL